MRTFRRLALVFRASFQRVADADPLDHEDLVLDVDLALRLRAQSPFTRVDPARLQRATQGAGESTGGGGDNIIEGRRVIGILPWCRAVVLAHLVVCAEENRFRLDWEKGAADGTAVANDPDP